MNNDNKLLILIKIIFCISCKFFLYRVFQIILFILLNEYARSVECWQLEILAGDEMAAADIENNIGKKLFFNILHHHIIVVFKVYRHECTWNVMNKKWGSTLFFNPFNIYWLKKITTTVVVGDRCKSKYLNTYNNNDNDNNIIIVIVIITTKKDKFRECWHLQRCYASQNKTLVKAWVVG